MEHELKAALAKSIEKVEIGKERVHLRLPAEFSRRIENSEHFAKLLNSLQEKLVIEVEPPEKGMDPIAAGTTKQPTDMNGLKDTGYPWDG